MIHCLPEKEPLSASLPHWFLHCQRQPPALSFQTFRSRILLWIKQQEKLNSRVFSDSFSKSYFLLKTRNLFFLIFLIPSFSCSNQELILSILSPHREKPPFFL